MCVGVCMCMRVRAGVLRPGDRLDLGRAEELKS